MYATGEGFASLRGGRGLDMRDDRYIEIPGDGTHELPPLLVHSVTEQPRAENMIDMASMVLEAEDMLPILDEDREEVEQRKFDLAVQLTGQYRGLLAQW